MFVAMVPFSTELTGDYGGLVTSNVIFHVNMLMIGLLLSASWFYAYKNGLMDVERDQYLRELKRNLLICGNRGAPDNTIHARVQLHCLCNQVLKRFI